MFGPFALTAPACFEGTAGYARWRQMNNSESWLNVSLNPRSTPAPFSCFRTGALLLPLQLVAQRPVVTPLQTALFALSFTRLDKVLQAARAFGGWLPAFRAALVPLHAQLILALPRDL